MIFRTIKALSAFVLLSLAGIAVAQQAVDKKVDETLRKALAQPALNLEVSTVEASEIPGIYAVQFLNGPLVYATADGKFFVVGDLYATGGDAFVNLTEQRRDSDRMKQLAAVKKEDMIIFPAKGETKTFISVFTDVTCFYCQKLHLEVEALNKAGIEVRYLAYPRAGLASDGYRKLETAWCAEDRQDTITRLKAKKAVTEQSCGANPIADQFQLGQAIGVRGTPAIVTQEGRLIPGYQAADELIANLGIK
jgi:thiol:disulfide interchange protein DsbC